MPLAATTEDCILPNVSISEKYRIQENHMGKRFILAILVLCSGAAFAQTQAGQVTKNATNFAQQKQMILQRLQGRQQAIQSAISCAQTANDRNALHACRQQMEASRGQ